MRNNKPIITYSLIIINVLVYLFMVISGNSYYYALTYALNSPITTPFVTYFSANFIHFSLMHILFNMFALLIFGSVLEMYLGRVKYLFYFIGCGFFTMVLTDFFTTTLTAGASGIIYAMLLTVVVLDRSDLHDFNLSPNNYIIPVIVFNLILSFILPGVSFVGHLCGVVVGIVAGLIIVSLKERKII